MFFSLPHTLHVPHAHSMGLHRTFVPFTSLLLFFNCIQPILPFTSPIRQLYLPTKATRATLGFRQTVAIDSDESEYCFRYNRRYGHGGHGSDGSDATSLYSSSMHGCDSDTSSPPTPHKNFDNIVVGGGLGGMTAFMLLTRLYDRSTLLLESHPTSLGGVAHTFDLTNKETGKTFTFDAGPSLLTGLSRPSYNPLRQAFDMAGLDMPNMIEYDGWMIHSYGKNEEQVRNKGPGIQGCKNEKKSARYYV